jgi:5-methylcytosine-specific restriction protein B
MKNADRIRLHGKERYVLAARARGDSRFSIPVRDVVNALGLKGRVPAVCSALETDKFLDHNHLRLVDKIGPESGQSTTVVYTYEFIDEELVPLGKREEDAWARMRGSLKDIFSQLGGGEAYLRAERSNFYATEADGK